jgi:translation initiation factor 2 subunit 1
MRTAKMEEAEQTKEELDTPCRMFAAEYPELGDPVMVRVVSVGESFSNVLLLEYGDKEAIVLRAPEQAWRPSTRRALAKRVGKEVVARVLRVDKEKGYVDLSWRVPSEEDRAKCTQRYLKSKAVHSVMTHVGQHESGEHDGLTLAQLYERVAWPLHKKFGHAYDAFEIVARDENSFTTVFDGIDIAESTMGKLLQAIQHHHLHLHHDPGQSLNVTYP